MAANRRVYIAGPMSGYPRFNYAAFDRAEQQLAAMGLEPVSPADPSQRTRGPRRASAHGCASRFDWSGQTATNTPAPLSTKRR